jgi:hypothetical protein
MNTGMRNFIVRRITMLTIYDKQQIAERRLRQHFSEPSLISYLIELLPEKALDEIINDKSLGN